MTARIRAIASVLALALAVAAPARAQVVRAFTPRFSTNSNGDVMMIGNTLMSCNGGGCANAQIGTGGSLNNNDWNMRYVDVDADGATFCSSTAQLAMPTGATVLWAGLYWAGYSNSGSRNTVRFSSPVAGYVTLTAARLDASGSAYQGFVDVTARVQAGGNGTYQTANVQSTASAGNYAGWSLVVVCSDPAALPRNLVVFDGYASVAPGASVAFTVNGFLTPPAGPVNTRLGVVAGEGDLGFTGDALLLNGVAVADAVNPATNFFNSSISRFGVDLTAKNPNYDNQLGFDIDLVSLTNAVPNGATIATITLNSTSDQYYPGVVTFATDLYVPVIGNGSFTKSVTDLNGGAARPGDVLEYTLTMTNTGQDGGVSIVMRDTLPPNAAYVPGTLSVASGANAGVKTDGAGDDQMDYLAGARCVVARLGTGASAAGGGSLAVNATTSVRFRAQITAPAPTGTLVSNQARLTYAGAQLGTALASSSDGDAATAGDQPTVTPVTAAVFSGTVFEDAGYGGGAGRTLAASAGVARPGARVELYDVAGAFITAVATDALGRFAFDGYAAGSYSVRVVNSTLPSSRPGAVATLLPVQTFRTDATTGSATGVADRVGGEIPARADAAPNTTSLTLAALTTVLATPQSVAPVTLATANITGMDFGFNFDTIVNANDSGQGSFRQFLLNANALGNAGLAQAGQASGIECSIFMVSDGAAHLGLRAGLGNLLAGGVVRLAPLTALPALTDAGTRVDGATQTVNVGNTSSVTLGTGGAVGVDALALPLVPGPEVELRDGAALAIGLDLQASGLAVAGLAIVGFGNAPASNADADVRIGATAASALIESCVLGSAATAFADPGAASRSGGDHVRAVGGDNGILRNSLVGFAAGSGVALTSGSDGWLITGCEIRGNAMGQPVRDGIAIESSTTTTARGNLVSSHEGVGIDARTSTGALVIENNAITRNGLGTGAAVETPGIRLGGNGSRVDRNVVFDNFGAGVLVISTGASNTITRNSIYGNGGITSNGGTGPSGQLGIDLLRAGDVEATGTSPFVTLNDAADADAGGNGLLNFPVLETAVLSNGSFTLTGWARPGSAIELFIATADPSGFGEGRSYVVTLTEGSGADLDGSSSAYAGSINALAQGADNTNRFRFTVAAPGGVSPGVRLSATATLAGATSEFAGLVMVTSGVGVSGFAYADLNHDRARSPGESGTGAALYAKLISSGVPGSAQAVAVVDLVTGAYAFTFVPAGTWTVLIDDTPSAADVTASYPASWIGTELPTGIRAGIAVGATDLANQNFGLWRGSRLDGAVFRDDGAGGGVPNDGAAQPGELGLAGARVRMTAPACAGGVCDSVLTDGAGRWTLWMPHAVAGAGLRVSESNPAGWISTGGSGGSTGQPYVRAFDGVDFIPSSGVVYTGVAFGDVPPNLLAPQGTRAAPAGAVVFHPHRFTASSAATVTFTTAQTPSPAIPGWAVELYRDLDCDGAVGPGEPLVSAPLALATGQSVCLVLKHLIPAGATPGARSQVTLSAAGAYANAAPALSVSVQAADLTTVVAGSGLEIVKSVSLASARPGDVLTYTVTYRNPGSAPLSSIVIFDATPPFTVFVSAGCGSLGAGLGGCAIGAAPGVGAPGAVRWTLSGALAPGGSGSVSYQVRVQ